jgi:hypothetical protein
MKLFSTKRKKPKVLVIYRSDGGISIMQILVDFVGVKKEIRKWESANSGITVVSHHKIKMAEIPIYKTKQLQYIKWFKLMYMGQKLLGHDYS